ncbi:hypothetical protein EJB05_35179, partial [Eragrostis curvula]
MVNTARTLDPKIADQRTKVLRAKRCRVRTRAHAIKLAHVTLPISSTSTTAPLARVLDTSFKASCTQHSASTCSAAASPACSCKSSGHAKQSNAARGCTSMAEHHLPPEPVGHHHKGVHAGDLKHGRRRRYGYYYGGGGGGDGFRTVCFAVLVLLLIIGIIWLVLYVVYRPSTPTFSVTSAAVLGLYNATTTTGGTGTAAAAAGAGAGAMAAGAGQAPTLLAASFQFTLVIRNPSGRSAARYDRLTAYAAYRGEALTPPTTLPPLAQDAGDVVAVSPVLGGVGAAPVPVSPDTAAALAGDVANGVVPMRVLLLGRVRFVSGPFYHRWHSMYARCDMLVGVRSNTDGTGAQAPLLGNPDCDVDI